MSQQGTEPTGATPALPPERDGVDDGGLSEDWAWRRRIRADARLNGIYRATVAIVGLLIVAGGLALVPLPGPGWLIVLGGVAVWASEFDWAKRLLQWARARLDEWTAWIGPKPLWVKGLVGLITLVLVLAVFWVLFKISGVPGFFPDFASTWLTQHAGL